MCVTVREKCEGDGGGWALKVQRCPLTHGRVLDAQVTTELYDAAGTHVATTEARWHITLLPKATSKAKAS